MKASYILTLAFAAAVIVLVGCVPQPPEEDVQAEGASAPAQPVEAQAG